MSGFAKLRRTSRMAAGRRPMDVRSSRYHDVYAHWQRNPELFWAEAAADIHWFEKPKKIFDKDAGIYGRWFTGATCNT
jgi:propionyl-CoA synthetase